MLGGPSPGGQEDGTRAADPGSREAGLRLGDLQPEESFLDLASVKVRLRVLGVGKGRRW